MVESSNRTVAIPRTSLSKCVDVVKSIHNTGKASIELDDLAANLLKIPRDSSGFRTIISSLQKFNLAVATRTHLLLTDLALGCLDTATERKAVIQALFTFEPYRNLYTMYLDGLNPDNQMLEKRLVECGVAEAAAPAGRRRFHSGAKYAQLFFLEGKQIANDILNSQVFTSGNPPYLPASHQMTPNIEPGALQQNPSNVETKIIKLSDSSEVSISLRLKFLELPLPKIQKLLNAIEEIEKLDIRNSQELV